MPNPAIPSEGGAAPAPAAVRPGTTAASSPVLLPLLFYVVLGGLLIVSRGNYYRAPLALLVVFWLAGTWSALRYAGRAAAGDGGALGRALPVALVACVVILAVEPYLPPALPVRPAGALLRVLLVLAVLPAAFLARAAAEGASTRWPAAALAAVLVVARVASLQALPRPWIDTFTTSTAAADYLLAGHNPYAGAYVDITRGAYGYAPGFYYWPVVVLWQAPFRWALGDIRLGLAAADALAAGLLLLLGRRLRLGEPACFLPPLLWLAFPVSLYVSRLSWVDPILVPLAVLTLLLIFQRRWLAAGIALGIFCAVKQYTVFFALLTAAFALRRGGARAVLRLAIGGALAFGAIVLPFALADSSFFDVTVRRVLETPMRRDSLSLLAAAWNEWRVRVPSGALFAAYAVATAGAIAWIVRSPRSPARALAARWAAALVAVYGIVFLLGPQAFCNYYYLLAAFLLLHLMLRLAPTDSPTNQRSRGLPPSPGRANFKGSSA